MKKGRKLELGSKLQISSFRRTPRVAIDGHGFEERGKPESMLFVAEKHDGFPAFAG
jgi:hypothetical protein